MEHGRPVRVWKLVGEPDAAEWTEYTRRWSGLRHVGEHCGIRRGTLFGGPDYVWIGRSVQF